MVTKHWRGCLGGGAASGGEGDGRFGAEEVSDVTLDEGCVLGRLGALGGRVSAADLRIGYCL